MGAAPLLALACGEALEGEADEARGARVLVLHHHGPAAVAAVDGRVNLERQQRAPPVRVLRRRMHAHALVLPRTRA